MNDDLPRIAFFARTRETDHQEEVRGILAYIHGTQSMRLMTRRNHPILVSSGKTLKPVFDLGLAGLISATFNPEAIDRLRDRGVAVVNLRAFEESGAVSVIRDRFQAGAMIVRRCQEDGIRRILCVDDRGMHAGILHGMKKVAPRDMRVHAPFDEWIDFKKKPSRLLEHLEPLVRASSDPILVVSSDDGQAVAILDVCRRADLAVPGPVNVIGYGNYDMTCESGTPPLASVDPDWRRVGYEAARHLDMLLQHKHIRRKQVAIPPLCIQSRESLLPVPVDKRLASALTLIQREYAGHLTVRDLARVAHVSRRTLENLFRNHLGRSPLEEVRRVRIARAREYLLNSDKKNEAISYLCGYPTLSHFYRDFRTCVGQSPADFRKNSGAGMSEGRRG